jgi:small subunit ribosomal protein S21
MLIKGLKVTVHDDNVDRALRKFKKTVADAGLLQEVKERQEFIKPTTKKKMAKNQAIRRWKKYLRDQTVPKKNF